MKKIFIILLILLFGAAILLMCLPRGVKMHFASAPEEAIEYYIAYASYFSLVPYGYGNFSPLLTAVMTVVAAMLSILAILKNAKKLLHAVAVLLVITVVLSLVGFLFDSYTIIGGLVTATLICTLAVVEAFSKIIGGEKNETK